MISNVSIVPSGDQLGGLSVVSGPRNVTRSVRFIVVVSSTEIEVSASVAEP